MPLPLLSYAHLVGDAKGQYVENSAIHDTYSRCVTVCGTNFVRVENNVPYNNMTGRARAIHRARHFIDS